jgi:prepilin-type N-terminal cleavage/methylation domain-containing protein
MRHKRHKPNCLVPPRRCPARSPVQHRFSISDCRGVTLIELVMVIVLTGAVLLIGAGIVTDTARSFDVGRDITDVGWQGRVALERMERDLRAVNGTAAITTWTATTLTFTNTAGTSIAYGLAGTTLQRTQAAGPARPLADNISSLGFTYWDRSGAQLTPAVSSVTDIYYITVALGVTKGDASSNYRTTVHPENIN